MKLPLFGKRAAVAVLAIVLIGGLAAVLARDPAAPAVTFASMQGKKIPLAALRGKVVLVNFWATSCPGCIKEMPELVKTYREYHGRGLEIVAVAMSYDPPRYVLNYTHKNGLPFVVAMDTGGAIAKAFGNVQLTPTSFIIDKDGRIIQRTVGNLDFGKLHTLLQQEL